jgi:hypothetical protein
MKIPEELVYGIRTLRRKAGMMRRERERQHPEGMQS